MTGIAPLMPYSLRMAFEGASKSRGHRPSWLDRASDIRFVGYSSEGEETLLCLGAPPLGEAAEELYRQQKLWDTRPSHEATAIDVFTRVVREVRSGNKESDWFDKPLLVRLSRLQGLFSRDLHSLRLPVQQAESKALDDRQTIVDARIAEAARCLSETTPQSRQVRVVGTLDMIRHSTRTFGLRLQDGTEVSGVVENIDQMGALNEHFGRKVLVLGKAVYRPSGRPLRIDATAVEPGDGQPASFAKIPPPISRRPVPVREKPSVAGKRGVAAFFGIWPGSETDAELQAMLREVRG